MLRENIVLSRLIFHAQQVEESRPRKRNKVAKKAKSFESWSSKSRLDVFDKPKFKKRFSKQVPSTFSKNGTDRDSNPKPQKERNVDPPTERSTYGKWGKWHEGECFVGTNSCSCCGKAFHKFKDCLNVRAQGRGNRKAQPSGPNFEAPKRNHSYALKSRGEPKTSPYHVKAKWQVLSVNVYAFMVGGDTLSFGYTFGT